MVGHRLRIFLVLLAVALNYVTCDYLSECPALAGPGCLFNDTIHPDGSYIKDQCLRLRCDSDTWVVTGGIDSDCGKCSVFLDPHMTTSDGYTFDLLQDPCNHSFIQTGLSYNPDVGISGHSKRCKDLGSCPGKTTFKDGKDAVEIGRDGLDADNIFKVYLGNDLFIVPDGNPTKILGSSVLAWRSGDSCIQLLGVSGLSMEKCEYHQFMWSHPNNAPYYGLCGFFEGNKSVENDLTIRSGNKLPLNLDMVPSFGYSWLTKYQEHPNCPGATPREPASLCQQSSDKLAEYDVNCTTVINSVKVGNTSISSAHFQTILDACIYDLCLVSLATEDNQNNISAWLNGPVVTYTERIIHLELTSLGCQFDGQNYLEGALREESCSLYYCHHGQWIKKEEKNPSCCSSGGEDYENGEEVTMDCKIMICNCGSWEDKKEMDPTCCEYNGVKYENGEQATIECWLQECNNGTWNRLSRDPDCCEYEDKKYKDGDQITFGCKLHQCKNGDWTFVSVDPNCCSEGNKVHPEGTTREVNCIIEECIGGMFVNTGNSDPDCCIHHGTLFPDGETKTIDCHVIVCNDGEWEQKPDTKPDPTCCEIGGRLFEDGTHAVVECNIFECMNGSWSDTHTMDPNCGNTGTSEHTEYTERCDETEACNGMGGRLIIQVGQQLNMP